MNTRPSPLPCLRTPRLILKGVRLKHAAAWQRHFADYQVIRHLSTAVPWPYPKDGAAQFIQNVLLPAQGKNRWAWGIFLKGRPDNLIGCVDLWRNQKGKPENRGFWLGRRFWGKGYMTEATSAVTDHAFRKLGFKKLVFANALGNRRSRRIKEKEGARLIGLESVKSIDPRYTKLEIWELTRADWKKLKSR